MAIPLGEVRKYIAAKKEKVYEVDPTVFEDVVGSIFQDFGYRIRVTGQRVPGEEGDDGIDVILESSAGTIGVQVRRYKKSLRIEADAIRSLAGEYCSGATRRGSSSRHPSSEVVRPGPPSDLLLWGTRWSC